MSGPSKLGDQEIASRLAKLPGWAQHGTEISKTFRFKNYYETIAFVNASAWVSHHQDHHPDLEVGYNTCKFRYSTHAAGGLTEKDFVCAGEVEKLSRP